MFFESSFPLPSDTKADIPGPPLSKKDVEWVKQLELQSLVTHPDVDRRTNTEAIDDYLTFGYIPAPKTIYENVFKLPPAHHLTIHFGSNDFDSGKLRSRRYWRLAYQPKLRLTEDEALERLQEVLIEAVRLRMISDVPIGALLSGGIDSSLVVALMSQLSGSPIKTFSIGFDEGGFNELPYARMVAERYGTDHHELIVRPNALEVLPKLVRHYGEPYSDSSAIPSYYVTQLTRQHVSVALNGDGGDESFAGYERYLGSRIADWYRQIPRIARRFAIEPALAVVPDSLGRRNRLRQAKRFVASAGFGHNQCYLRWLSTFTAEQKERLYAPEFRGALGPYQPSHWFDGLLTSRLGNDHDSLDGLLATDVESYLPYDLLVKMDIASMANSLECRSPLLDHKVMEFAAKLPARYKLRGRQHKFLLKQLAYRLLPREVIDRRKMGFGVPLSDWFRRDLRPLLYDVVLSETALARGYFRPAAVRCLVEEHVAGRTDHAYQLWALLWLELWHHEFVD